MDLRRGTSLIDLLVALGILAMLFGGIYAVYFAIIDASVNVEARGEAASLLAEQVEVIRNLPYEQVGTQSGIPSGVLLQERQFIIGSHLYVVKTTIRNIDDPFDGILGGSPGDTAPADYKVAALEVNCLTCSRFKPLHFTTTIAPKNLESTGNYGSLFVNVFDAAGSPISGANVRIVNASVTPGIDLEDITNNSGILQLVGVPTSTQSYQVYVSKEGYSSEQTYPLGAVSNPDPLKPHSTVALGTVTNVSFSIDKVSNLSVYTQDIFCAAKPNRNFSIAGSKLIGNPDVLKFSTSSQTDASGYKNFSNLEWDNYTLSFNSSDELVGTTPLSPHIINPSTTLDFRFILQDANPNTLAISVADVSGNAISGASVNLVDGGFNETKITGRATASETNWSSGNYESKDIELDTDTNPGNVTLAPNASGTYSTASGGHAMVSNTWDLGSASTTLYTIRAISMKPANTEVRVRLAANNDNSTWNFIGPDGTGNSYYTIETFSPEASLSGKRYVRYEITLQTNDENETPTFQNIEMDFSGTCTPPGNVIWNDLSLGSYSLSVGAPGYTTATSTVNVTGAWRETRTTLTE